LVSLLSGGGLMVLGLYANHPGFLSLWERRVQGSLLRAWFQESGSHDCRNKSSGARYLAKLSYEN
jgi:hypothetical protein